MNPSQLASHIHGHTGPVMAQPTLLISYDGQTKKEIEFEYGKGTEIFHACGLTLNDQMFIFGGQIEKRQISRIEGCGIVRTKSNLSFDFIHGGCLTIDTKSMNSVETVETAWLCFSASNPSEYRKCRSLHFTYDEGNLNGVIENEEPDSDSEHSLTPLSKYKNQPFALGSFFEFDQIMTKKPNRSEMFDIKLRTWIPMPEIPFYPELYSFSCYRSITVNNALFIFGGWG